ncbi:MAG: FtsX-like permease family protein [Lentisphaeria bacterium]|nr:FtsX-like permease family protein [Lentisphaeria bacterium]
MGGTAEQQRIFDERRQGRARQVVLPWRKTMEVCLSNLRHRMGRSLLTFVCIAVVVAFFTSAMTFQGVVRRLSERRDNVHTQAVLERAGVVTHDREAVQRQRHQTLWLMSLSGFLCLVGITNTILMSVTERFREIGTLKCLGALDSFVVRLFLVESILVGIVASLVGAALGCVLALLQAGAVLEFGILDASVCLGTVLVSVPVAVGLGTGLTTLAAVYPVYVAAKMKPVEAMRVEV